MSFASLLAESKKQSIVPGGGGTDAFSSSSSVSGSAGFCFFPLVEVDAALLAVAAAVDVGGMVVGANRTNRRRIDIVECGGRANSM